MGGPKPSWTFLSNHAHVLVVIGRNPNLRVREIAELVGVTERAALRILGELDSAGAISRERHGRRSTYSIHPECPLRHPLETEHTVGELVSLLAPIPSDMGAVVGSDGRTEQQTGAQSARKAPAVAETPFEDRLGSEEQ